MLIEMEFEYQHQDWDSIILIVYLQISMFIPEI